MFEAFPKLTRFSHDWTITEKVDGSNAQIFITNRADLPDGGNTDDFLFWDLPTDIVVMAGSRKKLLTVSKQGDHMGFAKFVAERAAEFVEALGEGRHFGEWYGNGIQRGYGLSEKRFMLFNPRWREVKLPDRVDVAPVLFHGYLDSTDQFQESLEALKNNGSYIAPGFMNPEGIVMYHGPSKTLFKKTFDYDEAGKWAENQERRANG